MSSLDPKVALLLDKDQPEDEDALIDALEDDPELDNFREQRLQQLHEEYIRAKELRANDHGTYAEIKDEKTLMEIVTSTKLCLVHFSHADFARCSIMHNHLALLAAKHVDTRFLEINVEYAPFLIEKLKVRVLPCLIGFIDGIGADRIVGFEGLGNGTDSFTTQELEQRLVRTGIFTREKTSLGASTQFGRSKKSSIRRQSDIEDDSD